MTLPGRSPAIERAILDTNLARRVRTSESRQDDHFDRAGCQMFEHRTYRRSIDGDGDAGVIQGNDLSRGDLHCLDGGERRGIGRNVDAPGHADTEQGHRVAHGDRGWSQWEWQRQRSLVGCESEVSRAEPEHRDRLALGDGRSNDLPEHFDPRSCRSRWYQAPRPVNDGDLVRRNDLSRPKIPGGHDHRFGGPEVRGQASALADGSRNEDAEGEQSDHAQEGTTIPATSKMDDESGEHDRRSVGQGLVRRSWVFRRVSAEVGAQLWSSHDGFLTSRPGSGPASRVRGEGLRRREGSGRARPAVAVFSPLRARTLGSGQTRQSAGVLLGVFVVSALVEDTVPVSLLEDEGDDEDSLELLSLVDDELDLPPLRESFL